MTDLQQPSPFSRPPLHTAPDTRAGAGAGPSCPRWLDTVAHTMSVIFSPLLVPTYGVFLALWLSVLRFLPLGVRWIVVGITFLTTCLLPLGAILVLWRMKVISDPGLNRRTERTTPYIITAICYLACAFYLYRAHAPQWLWAFLAGGAIAVAVCLAVNFRWKISAHLAGMGGLLAVLFRITAAGVNVVEMPVWLTAGVFLTGLLATSRVALNRHTVGQTLAGAAVGFLSVYLLSL